MRNLVIIGYAWSGPLFDNEMNCKVYDVTMLSEWPVCKHRLKGCTKISEDVRNESGKEEIESALYERAILDYHGMPACPTCGRGKD